MDDRDADRRGRESENTSHAVHVCKDTLACQYPGPKCETKDRNVTNSTERKSRFLKSHAPHNSDSTPPFSHSNAQ
ncbi:hypothetical protein EYF80_015896 [Liparis tanakae]|uniref:Uncharacterized protein n=1 Tax=Liparis tanakae TaxID=230148 RepID=A0A4Z2I746_9TELE|nr:hypothetical protein EYF80_015896 [Liparis tanakae]